MTAAPEDRDAPPLGHRLSARQAQAIARADPKVAAVRRRNPGSYDQMFLKGQRRWQLSLYAPGKPLKEIGQVIVDDHSARVTEAWTGPYVAWTMARGYDGAFGRSVTNPWLWGVLLVLFLAPFVGRRPARGPPVALVLLAGFSVPLAFFDNARLDVAVPMSGALLAALLVWALWRGLRRPRRPPRALRPGLPLLALVVLGVGLLVFRVLLNVVDGNVIDVGYASVVGADRIGHGAQLYGSFPGAVGRGDTYGPLTYLAYVPFEQLFPWSGRWDDLPAAHAASIALDLLACGALFLVGRRQERDPAAGRARGVLYAYLWLACPWTIYCLNSNANDALVALLLALLLLGGTGPLRRGVAVGAAAAAKIGPVAVLPLLVTRRRVAATVRVEHGPPSWRVRPIALVLVGALVVIAAATAITLIGGGTPGLVLDRTVGYQAGRPAPFTVWGLYDLDVGRTIARVLAAALVVGVAVVPRRHDLTGTAALAAATLVALQLSTEYWFYLYLVWLVPLIVVGALGDRPILWPLQRRPAVAPRTLGPLPEGDAPWAGRASRAGGMVTSAAAERPGSG